MVAGVLAKSFLYSYRDKNKLMIRNWKLNLLLNCKHNIHLQGWGNQHFICQAGIAFVVLNVLILKSSVKLVCKVKILVRP